MKSLLMLLSVSIFTNAFAGGYEKAVMWSGKWGALGGAAVGAADGADAAFFNPAGMVNGPEAELGVNASIVQSQFNGPGVADNTKLEGEKLTSILPGLQYKRNLNDNASYGISLAAIAGSKALHENVGSQNLDLSTNIQAVELGLSYARKINKNYSWGLTWRITQVEATFDTMPAATVGVKADNLSLTDFSTFRLGVLYEDDSNKWGWGATYRSELALELEDGDATVSGAVSGKGSIDVASNLPQSLAFGTWYQLNEKAKLYTELTWWDYSVNQNIDLEVTDAHPAVNGKSKLKQKWSDMYALKLGYEYMKDETLALRAGFAVTTLVTNADYARNTFSAPGDAYSIHFGAGKKLNENSTLDLGIEYVTSEGEGNGKDSQTYEGDFESYAYALHAGYRYAF